MKKILVTGGAGFIGSYIVDLLVENGDEVSIFDNLDPQVHPDGRQPDYLNKNARFIKGDVRDMDALAKAIENIEQIYHMAAAVGVGPIQAARCSDCIFPDFCLNSTGRQP